MTRSASISLSIVQHNTYEVDLRLVAHVTLHLLVRVYMLLQSQDAVEVISTQTIYDRLDWLQRPLVQDEVALEDVD